MSQATRVLAWAGGGIVLVALAIANAAGYRYGVSDQAFYIPSILRAAQPTLFPRDGTLLEAQDRLMVSDEITAWLVTSTGLRLEPLLLVAHIAGLLLLFAAVWLLVRRLSTSPWTAAACCLAVTLRHRITETGANSFEGYYHPRGLAFACGVAAAGAFAYGRIAVAWGLAVVAAVLHPTTGLWWLLWLTGATLVNLSVRARRLYEIAAAAALGLGALLVFTPLAERMRVMDPAWVRPFATKDYVFPTDWLADAWLANLVLPVVVLGVWRWRVRAGLAARWESGMVAGVLLLAATFVASLPFIAARLALAVQLQTSRVFWVIDLFAVISFVWLLAEGRRHSVRDGTAARPMARRPAAVAAVLLLASLARGLYVMEVGHPERAFVQGALENSDWVRVGRWLATRTPRDTHVLADPDHAWKFGHSVRVTARRDVLVEGVKDAAVALYDREVALEVQTRLEAVGDFTTVDASRATALARRFDLDVLVVDRDLPLPELHRDGRFRVYRLR